MNTPASWVGKKLKSGFDVFEVTSVRIRDGYNVELVCEVEGNARRTWVVPLQDDETLPTSVEEVLDAG